MFKVQSFPRPQLLAYTALSFDRSWEALQPLIPFLLTLFTFRVFFGRNLGLLLQTKLTRHVLKPGTPAYPRTQRDATTEHHRTVEQRNTGTLYNQGLD